MAYDKEHAGILEEHVFETANMYDQSKSAYKKAQKDYWSYMTSEHGYYRWLRRIIIAHNLAFLGTIAFLIVNYFVQKKEEVKEYEQWVSVAHDDTLVEEYHDLNSVAETPMASEWDARKFHLVDDELLKRGINPMQFNVEDPMPPPPGDDDVPF